jgi:ribonuclease E
MTDQTGPAGPGVRVPPGVDAGGSASELPEDRRDSEATTAAVPKDTASASNGDGADGAPARAATSSRTGARRSRRGGRGRGGSRARTTTGRRATDPDAGAASDDAVDAEPGDLMLADAPDAPVETNDETAPVGGASTSTGAARRRRRRGGRGRGGRGGSGGSRAAASTEAGGSLDEPELPEPEPRPEVAPLEAIADEEGDGALSVIADGGTGGTTTRRRRRRGGRGRGRSRSAASGSETETNGEAPTVEAVSEQDATADAPARARTRRPRSKKAQADTEGRETSVVATAGPTRLRRGRATASGTRRRREPLPMVPRVTDKLMVITEHGDRDQIAILEERTLVQHYVTRAGAKSMVGNVYLGRVQNVLPGMEAAFVDVGRGRNAVLYAGEVNYSPEDLEGKQPPRIEQVLKSGQSVLVQVTKDPIGGKGARLTAKISMPGRYLVLQPNWEITGISKRLEDSERKRLRALLKKIRPEGHGLIVRTAAEEATEEDLRADVERLLAEWNAIEKKARKAKAPAVLYEEPELTVKVVRDLFTDEEYRELVTDSQRVYTLVTQYLEGVAPDLLPKVRLHAGKLPAFEEFHVVEQIHKGLDRKVWLPSGGYLVIDRTEAMTVIDVNTGKSVGKTNLEETVVNTNIEAAREIARQLRLRDIGGMIIIDFIDMLLEQNKRRVVDTVNEEMARDKTRSQVFDISPLGLLEVTRKRVSGGLLESFSETCPTCEGRGVILTYEA